MQIHVFFNELKELSLSCLCLEIACWSSRFGCNSRSRTLFSAGSHVMAHTHRLKDCVFLANVHSGDQPRAADEATGNIGDDVTIEIRHQHNVKLLWPRNLEKSLLRGVER